MKKSNKPEKQIVKELLAWASQEIKDSSDSPLLDAEILLAEVTGKTRTFLFAHPEFELEAPKQQRFENFITRRKNHEPLAYILGYKDFFGHRFYVDSRVLIPRPETEELVQLAINKIKSLDKANIIIVDICTGSGCIGLSIALELAKLSQTSQYSIYASDLSLEALEVAKMNKNRLLPNLPSNINFTIIKSDLLTYFLEENIAIDILTANPPYIPDEEFNTLSKQIKDYEPTIALKGGTDGNDSIDKIKMQITHLPYRPAICLIEVQDGKIVVL